MKVTCGLLVFVFVLVDFAVCLMPAPLQTKPDGFLESEAFLESGDLSKRQTSTSTGIWLNPYLCQLTPVAVKVPSPAVFPSHVRLWRCMGATYNPTIRKCGIKNETHFHLLAFFDWTGTRGVVSMTNHTKCHDTCILEQKDCDNAIRVYDPMTCECMCRANIRCGSGKVWDTTGCKCKCINFARTCVGYEDTKIWSDNSCKCECQEKIKKKCQSAGHGKILRPDTCACVCPQKVCPKGHIIDQADCKCIPSG